MGLILQNQRSQLGKRVIALRQLPVTFRVSRPIDRERGETDRIVLADGKEDLGRPANACTCFGDEQGITGTIVSGAPVLELEVDIQCETER